MSTQSPLTPEKAYRDMEFLNSPDARVIRILNEYLDPQRRFRKLNLRDTVVFYGSARVCDQETAAKELKEAQRRLAAEEGTEETLRAALYRAETDCVLSRYYDEARILAHKMTE